MKFRELSVALVGLLLCAAPLIADDGGKPGRSTKEKTGCGSETATVPPGSSATNSDGVQVTNNAPSQGNCTLTPKTGGANCSSFASAKAGFSGSITGMDANDMADVAGPGSATVSGTGGTVSIGPGTTALVVNTNPAGSLGGNITVHAPGGPFTVGPGQSQLFHT